MIETWQVEWYHDEKKQWVTSWQELQTEEQARRYLERDKAYFYQRIKIRLVRIERHIIEETRGTQ